MTVIIGIDPHKATRTATHMAVAIDGDERSLGEFDVRAQRNQTERLLVCATPQHPARHGVRRERLKAKNTSP